MRLKIIVISLLITIFALAKENNMENMIEKVELVEIEGESVIEITLCNRSNEVYYYFKDGMQGSVLHGFAVRQNGKEIENTGPLVKYANIFPDSYDKINPKECMVYSAELSLVYDFNPNEEVEIAFGKKFYDAEGEDVG